MTAVWVIGNLQKATNRDLVTAWRALGIEAELIPAHDALAHFRPGDVALGRIDVAETVDGVEPGLLDLLLLERGGIDVRNGAAALLAVHDKLRTAARLTAAGIPHPRTGLVRAPDDPLPLPPPLVVKPRFGSWGRDVYRCSSEHAARCALAAVAERSWFRRHGALVQELVPSGPRDLRIVVAGETVVGACARSAAPGEWRTNVSLGGSRMKVSPDSAAAELAINAARVFGADLVGVDLLRLTGGTHVVLELNGAVDFDRAYSLGGRDVYADIASALELPPRTRRTKLQPRIGEVDVADSAHAP